VKKDSLNLNLTKKQALEMIKGYQREIKNAERFYKEELELETKNYKEGIRNCKKLLLQKFNIDFDELDKK
tara:strand:+ start:194 stop:403 length:210 start_codon:yes stop_codon:yes gene_type:complete